MITNRYIIWILFLSISIIDGFGIRFNYNEKKRFSRSVSDIVEYGKITFYIRESCDNGSQNIFTSQDFPYVRSQIQPMSSFGSLTKVSRLIPIYVNQETKETFIRTLTAIYIIPSMINSNGVVISIGELIIKSYASVFNNSFTIPSFFHIGSFIRPLPDGQPINPAYNSELSRFNDSVHTNYQSNFQDNCIVTNTNTRYNITTALTNGSVGSGSVITEDTITGRRQYAAVRLSDGSVLVTGGIVIGATETCEIYDPTTKNWTSTGSMLSARYGHIAILLPNGKVLVAGGVGSGSSGLNTAELYDPTTGNWAATGSMNFKRETLTGHLLNDGSVLAIGGMFDSVSHNTAELYDVSTGHWTLTKSMTQKRYKHASSLLLNGKVLVTGGTDDGTGNFCGGDTSELFDVQTGNWTAAGKLGAVRSLHSQLTLPNGSVLIAAGNDLAGNQHFTTELYDPISNSWTRTGNMTTGTYDQAAFLSANGEAVIAGGYADGGAVSRVEIYDSTTNIWTTKANMKNSRSQFSGILLLNGKVLIAGGIDTINYLKSSELYQPV